MLPLAADFRRLVLAFHKSIAIQVRQTAAQSYNALETLHYRSAGAICEGRSVKPGSELRRTAKRFPMTTGANHWVTRRSGSERSFFPALTKALK